MHVALLPQLTCSMIAGFSSQSGAIFAIPGVGEKGYLDVRLDISTPGGHSSIPPSHTVCTLVPQTFINQPHLQWY